MSESPSRIEPTRLEEPTEIISDLVAELSAVTATLGRALHPRTAENLAGLVRLMNTYYSNLIEGHNTRPRDIERAILGQFDSDLQRRNLQSEAQAHLRVQAWIDEAYARNQLPDPVSGEFIRFLHREFYRDAPQEMIWIESSQGGHLMRPGEWRSAQEENVMVGRHLPPSSAHVDEFMSYFSEVYGRGRLGGKTAQIVAIATSHHRFNYIHPFPDGNGRVSRLMSHALAQEAGVGAHGLWSISRGLARGLTSRTEYKSMMDLADTPRRGDLDGRGNLSRQALIEFVEWFLKVCVDQAKFMSGLFEIDSLFKRFGTYVERSETLETEALRLLEEALVRGQFERGEVSRITGLPERTARRVLSGLEKEGLLASDTPKGPVSLRFPVATLDGLFPKLFLEV